MREGRCAEKMCRSLCLMGQSEDCNRKKKKMKMTRRRKRRGSSAAAREKGGEKEEETDEKGEGVRKGAAGRGDWEKRNMEEGEGGLNPLTGLERRESAPQAAQTDAKGNERHTQTDT